jgi:hypothetical protein
LDLEQLGIEVQMTIQLKPEQEQLINRAIQAGPISGADEVVDVGVETIRQRLEARQSGTTLKRERMVKTTRCIASLMKSRPWSMNTLMVCRSKACLVPFQYELTISD